jgi:hypothetical protein
LRQHARAHWFWHARIAFDLRNQARAALRVKQ